MNFYHNQDLMDLKKHWNNVAEQIIKRDGDTLLVGYDNVLDRYIRNKFEEIFNYINFF